MKLIFATKHEFCKILCDLFNLCIVKDTFPSDLKKADISPVFKKLDSLSKENYRSINILPTISKIFEKIIADQILNFLEDKLSQSLSAYRRGYSCQHVLIHMTEYIRKALDDRENVCCIAMDLSEAFDRIPHGLLITKLHAYGFSVKACRFMSSYLRDRLQRVKISGTLSNWECVNQGVPQGSVLGPLLFNIFLNDLFFTQLKSEIFNYADDNTVCYRNSSVRVLTDQLVTDVNEIIKWFEGNYLDANPDKFQCLSLGTRGEIPSISIKGSTIDSESTIKIIGVNIDNKLKFSEHISSMCISASRQLNALKYQNS